VFIEIGKIHAMIVKSPVGLVLALSFMLAPFAPVFVVGVSPAIPCLAPKVPLPTSVAWFPFRL
jgi:hypothetical protein